MKNKGRIRIIALLCCGMLMGSAIPFHADSALPAGYIPIATEQELLAVQQQLDGNYMLTQDITLSEAFSPLAPDEDMPFTGVLDGAGHVISGLRIEVQGSGTMQAGLLGYNAGTVTGLSLEQVVITAEGTDAYANAVTYAGGIAARNAGTIEKCSVSGRIAAQSRSFKAVAGSIAGENTGEISRCAAFAGVSATGAEEAIAGGICGWNQSRVANSFNTQTVEALGSAVNGMLYSGGIAGKNGLAGDGTLQNCYNRGNTLAHGASPAQAGGIAGSNLAEIRNCYYDQEKAASAVGGSDEQTGALTDQQLHNSASFAGFDFTAVWAMRDYPILRDVRQMSNIIVGDVDTNGIVETADVLLLLHVLNGNTAFRPTLEAADLSGDGRLSIADAVFLLQQLAGM